MVSAIYCTLGTRLLNFLVSSPNVQAYQHEMSRSLALAAPLSESAWRNISCKCNSHSPIITLSFDNELRSNQRHQSDTCMVETWDLGMVAYMTNGRYCPGAPPQLFICLPSMPLFLFPAIHVASTLSSSHLSRS